MKALRDPKGATVDGGEDGGKTGLGLAYHDTTTRGPARVADEIARGSRNLLGDPDGAAVGGGGDGTRGTVLAYCDAVPPSVVATSAGPPDCVSPSA